MKANELRVGNYVQDEVGVAYKASAHSIKCLSEREYCFWIHPIPLTEELLVRCGFVKIISTISGTELKDEYELKFVRISHYFGQFHFHSVNIKYVHQLQNLYFALVGEELIFKP